MDAEPRQAGWPAHLPVGALRVVRWSARYEETVAFYRDAIGLPVLETFRGSYGLDGTILGLPGGQVHLEIVRAGQASYPGGGLDQLVFYLPDAAAREQMQARLAAAGAHPVPQIAYWQALAPGAGSGLRGLPGDVLLGSGRSPVCAAVTTGHEPAGLVSQAARLAGRR